LVGGILAVPVRRNSEEICETGTENVSVRSFIKLLDFVVP